MTDKVLLIAAVAAALCCGCGKDEEKTPSADPYDTPFSRMDDPEYRKALQDRVDGRKELMRETVALAKELEAERAKDPASAKVKELEEKQRQLAERHLQQRAETQRLVAERVKREAKAVEDRKAREAGTGAK